MKRILLLLLLPLLIFGQSIKCAVGAGTSVEIVPAVCSIQLPIYERDNGDANWVGWCWKNEFTKASDLSDYYSPAGEPIAKFTKQTPEGYSSWIYHSVMGWFGTDFDLRLGHGLSVTATENTVLLLQGSYLPNSIVELDENKNWITIPDNTIYVTISDVADDLSPTGSAVEKFSRMTDAGLFESWLWDPDFEMWDGSNFTLVSGEAVEFDCNKDTVWNPIEEVVTSIESKPYDCSIQYPINENPGATSDRNWVGWCWDNTFTKVSELADYYSLKGVPITKINKQMPGLTVSWIYHSVIGWYGTDFDLRMGHGLEVIAEVDAVLWLQGAYFPDSIVELDEGNNWVSIPDNTIYTTISDIAMDINPTGSAVAKFTRLLDNQSYVSWQWDSDFEEWYGVDFTFEAGEAIQFVCTKDTVWNPIEE